MMSRQNTGGRCARKEAAVKDTNAPKYIDATPGGVSLCDEIASLADAVNDVQTDFSALRASLTAILVPPTPEADAPVRQADVESTPQLVLEVISIANMVENLRRSIQEVTLRVRL